MANKLTIALLLIALCLSGSIAENNCWKSKQGNLNLLDGDHYNLNLDEMSVGNNLAYSVVSDQVGAEFTDPQTTFSDAGQSSLLLEGNPLLKKCTDRAKGLNENDLVLLCDQRHAVFADYHLSNGSVISSSVTSFGTDETTKCNALETGRVSKHIYIVCTVPDYTDKNMVNIALYRIDPAIPGVFVKLIIRQLNSDQTIKENLKMSVSQIQYENELDTLIYIWEGSRTDQKANFRVIKDRKGTLIDGGYYAATNDLGEDVEDGSIVTFFEQGTFVHVITKKDSAHYAQKCYRSPVYSKFICIKDSYTKLISNADKMFFRPVNKVTGEAATLYFTSATAVTYGTFSGQLEKPEFNVTGSADITGNSLKKTIGVFFIGDSMVLVGPTTDNQDLIDGILKFKLSSSNYDEVSYKDNYPSYAFALVDAININYGFLISVGGNKLTMYKIKHNFLPIISTGMPEEQNVTIKCFDKKTSQSQETSFVVKNQKKVNDNPRFALDSVESFVGAKMIGFPSNEGDILGNAPEIKIKEADSKIKINVEHMNKKTVEFKSAPFNKILHLNHVGQNVFVYVNDGFVAFFRCERQLSEDYQCKEVSLRIKLSEEIEKKTEQTEAVFRQWTYVDASVANKVVMVLLSAKNEIESLTRLVAYDINDGQSLFDPVNYEFATTKAVVEMEDTIISVIAIGSPKPNTPQGIYGARFKFDAANIPKVFNKYADTPRHMCPTQLWWSPHHSGSLYIASICGQSATDNHIFVYSYERSDNPKVHQLNTPIKIEGSKDFSICAHTNLVNVIDQENVNAYSIRHDAKGHVVSQLQLPIKRYGLTKIVDYHCDSNNGILQILALRGENEQFLVTFRGDESKPNYRVHSVVSVSKDIKKVASTFNDDNDNAQTVLITDTNTDIQLYIMEAEGPHVHVEIPSITEAGIYNFTWQITYPANGESEAKTIYVAGSLNLQAQDTGVKVTVKNMSKLAPVDGSIVDLDQYLVIEGPYTRAKARDDGRGDIFDRLSPSQQFSDQLTTFTDAIVDNEHIFGYNVEGSEFEISLTPKGKEKLTESLYVKRVDALRSVRVSKDRHFFFARVYERFRTDRLVAFYTLDGGNTWQKATVELEVEALVATDILVINEETLVFIGYSNNHQYSAFIIPIKISDKEIAIDSQSIIKYKAPRAIADMQAVFFEGNSLILIVNTEFGKQAKMIKYSLMDKSNLLYTTDVSVGLVPNVIESHRGITFKCRKVEKEESSIRCVKSGKNINSYVTKYTLDIKDTFSLTVTEQKIESYLRNVVNLRPVRSDLSDEYVAFVVKNLYPRPVNTRNLGEDPVVPGQFFTDTSLVVVYKLDSLTAEPATADDIAVRHPYKIIQSSDFKQDVREAMVFSKLDARFFRNSDNSPKLIVNTGAKAKSVRVFNMDSLRVVLNKENVASNGGSPDLVFENVYGSEVKVPIDSIMNVGPKPVDPTLKPTSKSSWILIVSIIVIVIVVVLIFIGIAMASKSDITDEADLNIDEVEKTMKMNDDSESGNYSKL